MREREREDNLYNQGNTLQVDGFRELVSFQITLSWPHGL